MNPALELVSVTKRRGEGRQAVQALTDVTLRVEAGELVLLFGPSGSGKTTVLAVAAGLLTADAGEVRIAGRLLGGMSAAERRRVRATDVGFVFQRSNLLPSLTALENVVLQAALAGLSASAARSRALELLDALEIRHLRDRLPSELSAGEEQRFAVARALVHGPTLVLADEPTASLDRAAGQRVLHELTQLARARRAAAVVATHDLRLEAPGCRRWTLRDGRLEGGERG
jgi:putative ABC transport system ATP-binding protein